MNKNLYQKLFTKISRLILDYYKREEVILRDICLDWGTLWEVTGL